METPGQIFMRRLVVANPVLAPLLDEHLDDLDGELLPHLLMADVERWVAGRTPDDVEAQRVLAGLEEGLAEGGEEVENVIAVSFLEFWPRPPQPGGEWRGRFPVRLAALLADMDDYRPGS